MQHTEHERGFTLLEALVASLIFGLLMVGAFTLYASNQTAYRRGQSTAEVQQNARVALQTISRQVRVAGYDTSGVLSTLTSPTAIQAANQNDLTFVADVDQDGVLDKVRYRLQGSRLLHETSSWDGLAFPAFTTSELADGLSLLNFNYFDDTTPANTTFTAPVAAANLGDIRRITISLVTSDTTVAQQENCPLVMDVQLRN